MGVYVGGGGVCVEGILKGELSLYCRPIVLLVWISQFCKKKLSVVTQLITNQSNKRSTVHGYFHL